MIEPAVIEGIVTIAVVVVVCFTIYFLTEPM